MSEDWVPAAFGLAGTVAGALAAIWGAVHERRHVAKKAEAAAREEARIAARILRVDVVFARERLRNAVANKRYWSSWFALPHESWAQYREKVARDLGMKEWNTVSLFFRSMANFEAGAQVARRDGDDRPVLTEPMQRAMQEAVGRADEAAKVLEDFTHDHSSLEGDGLDPVVAPVHAPTNRERAVRPRLEGET